VLEIGCGTGIYAGILERMYSGIDYLGVDANPEALAIARRRNPDLQFIEGDFRDFGAFRPFDLVCAHAFLKHFDHKNWLELFPKFLSLGGIAQFDMQTTSLDTFNDGSPSFGNNLWVNEGIFHKTLEAAGHRVISGEVAYRNKDDDRHATIFLTRHK
jgi:SAM-dependent methyltransferase